MRKYSVILGNLGNTKDRFCGGYKESVSPEHMLERVRTIEHVSGIELVGTWDVCQENARERKKAIDNQGLECVSIIPDLFSQPEWQAGTLSAKDPAVRSQAMDYLRRMADVARLLDCDLLNIWPGQDGYDYPLQSDLLSQRHWFAENVAALAAEFPDLRFALEYKPKEPRTHSCLARMADTLLVCLRTGRDNVGVTIDTGHAFVGGENVAESVVLAKEAGNRLFHMHFNDNYKEWDDDMMVGSIHTIEFIEMLYWLDACGYGGWYSMDQYPYREDAAAAIGESIQWLTAFDGIVVGHREELRQLIEQGDPVETSRWLRGVLL